MLSIGDFYLYLGISLLFRRFLIFLGFGFGWGGLIMLGSLVDARDCFYFGVYWFAFEGMFFASC